MQREILQKAIPYNWNDVAKLPGVMPLDPQEWIIFDEAYEGQMTPIPPADSWSRVSLEELQNQILKKMSLLR